MSTWDPPAGGVPLDLRGTPGSATLDLGAAEAGVDNTLRVAARIGAPRASVALGVVNPVAYQIAAHLTAPRAVVRATVANPVTLSLSARVPGVRALVRATASNPVTLRIAAAIPSVRALVRAVATQPTGGVSSPRLDLGGPVGSPKLILGRPYWYNSIAVRARVGSVRALVRADVPTTPAGLYMARLDLGGQPGRTRLDLGRHWSHDPLIIRARIAPPRALVRCDVEAAPTIAFHIAARIAAPRASIRAQFALPLRIAARIHSAPRALVRAAYDPNLLSDVVAIVNTAWTAAALLTVPARLSIQDAQVLHGAARSIWRPAPLVLGYAHSPWRHAVRAASLSGRASWSPGSLTENSRRSPWRDSPPLRQGDATSWSEGRGLPTGTRSGWRGLPLVTRGTLEHWHEGAIEQTALRIRFADGARLPAALITRWRDAALVLYVWRNAPPIWPPSPPDPDRWSPRLCLSLPLNGGRLDLGVISCLAQPIRIPTRRCYFMDHDMQVVRLSDRLEIATESISLSLDADAWAWSWSGTFVGLDALDAIMPSEAGEPVALEIALDGYLWHVLCEDWSETTSFGQRSVRVTGRGLSAELAEPAELKISGTLQQARTLRQALAERIPLDSQWTSESLLWADDDTPDWLIPAGAWSWSGVTPIQIIAAINNIGLVVVPGMAARTLTVQRRYPVLPWQFFGEAGDEALATPGRGILIPDGALAGYTMRQAAAPQANAVYVHGADVGGILARVFRAGTAGDRVASTVSDPLITHIDAARLLGERTLAAQERQPQVRSVTLPFADGSEFPLVSIGQLLAIEIRGTEHRGIVNSVSISAGKSLMQTLTIGEDTPNVWARWRRLLPGTPLLSGTVAVEYPDGTVLVSLIGGGTIRVRGEATVGSKVWVKDGRIDGTAPALPAYEIEVF